jgi:hypothetical protein
MFATKEVPELEKQRLVWLARGKKLLTVEEWESFAYCPSCYKQKCSACVRVTMDCAEIFRLLPEGLEPEYYPPHLFDKAIRCCSCECWWHITDWLRETFWPELYDIPEVEKTLLRRAKKVIKKG